MHVPIVLALGIALFFVFPRIFGFAVIAGLAFAGLWLAWMTLLVLGLPGFLAAIGEGLLALAIIAVIGVVIDIDQERRARLTPEQLERRAKRKAEAQKVATVVGLIILVIIGLAAAMYAGGEGARIGLAILIMGGLPMLFRARYSPDRQARIDEWNAAREARRAARHNLR